VVARFRDDPAIPQVAEVWAFGDNVNDAAMLRSADRRFVIEPKVASLAANTGATVITSFEEMLSRVPAR